MIKKNKIPGLLSINIPGINNEIFIKRISGEVAISSGSACSYGESSYVLENITSVTTEALRITLSKESNFDTLIEL